MNNEIQNKYLEYQQLNAQLQQLQKQFVQLEQQMLELNMLKEGVNDIKKLKPGDEILTSLGSGLFIKTELKDNNQILMNVGSKTVVTKTPSEAEKILTQQQDEIKSIMENIKTELQQGVKKLNSLQQDLNKLQAKK